MGDSTSQRAVTAYYDRLAPVYGDGEYFEARRAAVLRVVATEIARVGAVLDLGCGNGAYMPQLAACASGALVIGADLSPAMLTTARQRLGARTPLVRADAVTLPFRAGSFDLVFMSHVLLLVGDIERCVAEVANSLTAGGFLIATAGSTGWGDTMREFLGAEQLQQLEGFLPPVGCHMVVDDDARATAACAHSGLQPEWRSAAFCVSWPALEAWVRMRWLSIAEDALREDAERWFAQLRERASGRTLQFTERLLVAQKARNDEGL